MDHREPDNKKSRMGMLASIGVGASFLVGKTKYALVALKLTKAAPLVSMIITSLTYSLFFGWPYALGMVGQILAHESGHALVMLHFKVPFSPMVFIPFVGAVIAQQGPEQDAYTDALIAFGGPAVGTAVACGISVAGSAYDSQLLLALADFGYMINLFNLMPLGMLDGGRIGTAISPWFNVAGVAGGGWLIYSGVVTNPIFYLIMMGGCYSTAARMFGWEERENKNYYRVPGQKQAALLSGYVGLVTFLLYAMGENNRKRKTPRQLQAELDGTVDAGAPHNPSDGLYDDFFASSDSGHGEGPSTGGGVWG